MAKKVPKRPEGICMTSRFADPGKEDQKPGGEEAAGGGIRATGRR